MTRTTKPDFAAIDRASPEEQEALAQLALGRIFGMMMRPYKDGDIQEYETCRAIIMACSPNAKPPYQPNYARDRNSGAQGD